MRQDTFPPVIFALLMINALVFVAENFFGLRGLLQSLFALFSLGERFMPWQLLTYGFLHNDVYHLAFNMFGLWMFGRTMEGVWGSVRFLQYYLLCIVGAGLCQLLATGFPSSYAVTVGASGGLFGILLAFGMTFPNRYIVLLVPPIPMKAKYFVAIYAVFELYSGWTRPGSGIAHFAHLGGLVTGLLLILYWRKKRVIR
ncbi:MAG: rhomboid family intramembrane serine protease [Pseudomonadota bacterium]